MGKNRSIFQQFNNAINNCFKEGMDKHADKAYNPVLTEKIYSYSAMNNLKDFAKNLSNYIKENYPYIKRIGDIKEEQLQNFLNNKNQKGCSQNTLDLYKSNLNKLEMVVNKTYSSVNWDFKNTVETPASIKEFNGNRGVNSVISREDYNKILNYCRENKSTSGDAILLQNGLGIRVEELAQIKIRNIDLDNNVLILDNTKGGKELIREMTPEVREIIQERMSIVSDKIIDVKSDSINAQLRRIEDRLGLPRHSNHDIRRLIAQEHYDAYREEGYSKKKALEKTSKWLNHVGPREQMITKSYITIR
ncbi:tyrosine-type recombinase/integrase [Clostridium paraputrificum]|uniref:tyrosine-type recombinase/integrase n=1 Tax=Clostridium paraputrificum TaxID=29363 RepID=UPI00232BD024|nr:tyrosine-type recombinase/integrase [Clostridium paraputrificum]MDB2091116.1 tyrosine-type recombinase/integrase [Clostridium paraputrificum]MDB2097873.1 tyrosine-type recombinase/integrase [Clostridium paraputrificum]